MCSLNYRLMTVGLMWALASNLQAQAPEDSVSSGELDSRHRIGLSTLYFDFKDSNSLIGLFDYAYNLTPKSNLALQFSFEDVNFLKGGGSGMGDTNITYSYEPFSGLSVNPWVPRKIGSGISITLPTGDAEEGHSLDAALVNPFVGGVFFLKDNFALTPLVSYSHSLDPIATGNDLRVLSAEIGLVWKGENSWAGFYPTYVWDQEANKEHLNLNLSIGMIFSDNWGGSIEYSDLESFEPGILSDAEDVFDQSIQLSVYFLF